MRTQFPGSPAPARRRTKLRVRHFCAVCDSRVFPFDSYDVRVVAPVKGKLGGDILQTTFNARDPDNRICWCWSCEKRTPAKRETELEFKVRYLSRPGIKYRTIKKKSSKVKDQAVVSKVRKVKRIRK